MAHKVEDLKLEIGIDSSLVKDATDALNDLAAAAQRAKEALDALFGHPALVTNVVVDCATEDMVSEIERSIGAGARPSGARFSL